MLLSIITLVLLFILSQGLYIVLIKPLFYTRAYIGIGIFFSIIALDSINIDKKSLRVMSYILVIPFSWYLISFATYYGQTLKEHNDYQTFRYTILANDLSKVLDLKDRNPFDDRFNILFGGYAGDSPAISKSKYEYPIIRRLMPIVQKDNTWGITMLINYGINATDGYCYYYRTKHKKLIFTSYYHNIYKFKDRQYTCYYVEFLNHVNYSKWDN